MKKLIAPIVSLAVVVVAALWLYGYVGIKAGWIGPTEVSGLNAVSQHGAETAGGAAAAAKKAVKDTLGL